jgi:hypothetical protein
VQAAQRPSALVSGRTPLRSKRSRVRVAPGPLWKLLPRFDFGRGGDFRSLPYPAAGIDLLLPVNNHVAVDVT